MAGSGDKKNNKQFFETAEELKNQIPFRANFTRRKFVKKGLMGGAGIIAGTSGLMAQTAERRKFAASDKIILGVMGLGGRNCYLVEEFIKQGAEIAYICDVDTRRYVNGFNACKEQKKPPKAVQDFRRILDDKNVTAMVIAPGSHWAPLGTIMSCQAGKDVYVEKPMKDVRWSKLQGNTKGLFKWGAKTEVDSIMKKLLSFSVPVTLVRYILFVFSICWMVAWVIRVHILGCPYPKRLTMICGAVRLQKDLITQKRLFPVYGGTSGIIPVAIQNQYTSSMLHAGLHRP